MLCVAVKPKPGLNSLMFTPANFQVLKLGIELSRYWISDSDTKFGKVLIFDAIFDTSK